jgi:hypothetical protein
MGSRPRNRQDWLKRQNEGRIERLLALTPDGFPQVVWGHALRLELVPETPWKAVEAYWQAHPLRADRLARALAARSGGPPGWRWRLAEPSSPGVADSFRIPPLPYREPAHAPPGGGSCCVCGQPVYRYGWHESRGQKRPATARASWHAACVVAWRFWNAPSEHDRLLKRVQRHRCAATQRRLLRDAEVDHRIPLFRVWRDARDAPWPELLAFWGVPNLQVINRDAHRRKCAEEARDRAQMRLTRPGEDFA